MLFIDLHGYDEARRVSATAALSTFVSALGVDANQIRREQASLELLYRSVLSMLARQGRRVLVLVDNAAGPDQVLPLRPGNPAHRMLVTSRHNLPITGARLELDLLPEADALVLLDHAVRAANADDTRIARHRSVVGNRLGAGLEPGQLGHRARTRRCSRAPAERRER